jgi:protein gp37
MAQLSKIEWTDATWNPVTGCTKISAGCAHCYAERMAHRLKAMGQERYKNEFNVTLHDDLLDQPLRWKKSKFIFVNSMSDFLHEDVPLSFVQRIFAVMNQAHWHIFQVLTKRAGRLEEVASVLPWPRNVWLGVTVEKEEYLDRVRHLVRTPAAVKFVSLEPLLGPIRRLPLDGTDWVIVGGESGPHARAMEPDWVRMLRDQCVERRVPFFFKQWGGFRKTAAGRTIDGSVWDEMPRASGYRASPSA